MVAVVVPSPATSEVFDATTLTSLAPMFSNGSGSSISLETVTPSLVTVGPPYDLLRITLRPVGPSVVPTARASVSTPSSILRRAASEKSSCLATVVGSFYPERGRAVGGWWLVVGRRFQTSVDGSYWLSALRRLLRALWNVESSTNHQPPTTGPPVRSRSGHLTIFARMSDSRR